MSKAFFTSSTKRKLSREEKLNEFNSKLEKVINDNPGHYKLTERGDDKATKIYDEVCGMFC